MNKSAAAVLIYDGGCAYRPAAASALKRLDDVKATPRYDDVAQAFPDAQLADVLFAMVLVDRREDRVYAGRAAAKELTGWVGMSGPLGNLARGNYDRIAKVAGVVSGRGRDPDDTYSVYDLELDAADPFAPLLDNAEL